MRRYPRLLIFAEVQVELVREHSKFLGKSNCHNTDQVTKLPIELTIQPFAKQMEISASTCEKEIAIDN